MYDRFFKYICSRWIPTRVIICIMCFTACWTSYSCRLQMPILVVPMISTMPSNATVQGVCTPQSNRRRRSIDWLDPDSYIHDHLLEERLALRDAEISVNGSVDRFKRQVADARNVRPSDAPLSLFSGLPFEWTPTIRGQLIAAYSYGNVPGNFLGGVMALRLGPRRAVLWSSILAASVSLISPIIAQMHWGLLLVSRIIIGLTGGVTFPACHQMVAKWAPPNEKARFIWSLLGGTFGTILTYPMIAGIAEKINWESGWYIPSVLMFGWCIVWAIFAFDSPVEHPGITEEEKEYILTAQAGTVTAAKPKLKETPLKAIFTSIPFLSLLVCHFGNLFLLFFYQNSMMLYLTKALGFQLTKGGVAAGLPWAGRMTFGFFFCWVGDKIKSKQIVSVTTLRKGATVFSHLIPGIFLIFVGYAGCNLILANVFLILAMGFNGAASISNLSNNQDLSPNFAGFLYGIMNTVGVSTGMIIPPLVEEIAGKYGNPIDRWQTLFWIGSAVCIVCMIVFIIGGSGKIQPWNEIAKPEERAEAGERTDDDKK